MLEKNLFPNHHTYGKLELGANFDIQSNKNIQSNLSVSLKDFYNHLGGRLIYDLSVSYLTSYATWEFRTFP